MAVTISGKLIGPNGDPRSGVTIQLRAVKTSSAVVQQAPSTSVTGNDGSYSLSVEVGTHEVMIEAFGQPYEKVGTITVYEDSTSGTLNDFLISPGESELTPAIVAAVEGMRIASLAARDETLAARDEAKSYADSAQNAASGTGLKPDKATGLAQTSNGQTFSVAGEPGSGVAVYVYRNDSGTATLIYTLSSKDAMDAIEASVVEIKESLPYTENIDGFAEVEAGEDGKPIRGLMDDGTSFVSAILIGRDVEAVGNDGSLLIQSRGAGKRNIQYNPAGGYETDEFEVYFSDAYPGYLQIEAGEDGKPIFLKKEDGTVIDLRDGDGESATGSLGQGGIPLCVQFNQTPVHYENLLTRLLVCVSTQYCLSDLCVV